METPLFMFWIGAMVAMLFFDGRAFAQGCNLAVRNVDIPQTRFGVDIVEQFCEGPGTPGYYH
jgi:hypothetical protein